MTIGQKKNARWDSGVRKKQVEKKRQFNSARLFRIGDGIK